MATATNPLQPTTTKPTDPNALDPNALQPNPLQPDPTQAQGPNQPGLIQNATTTGYTPTKSTLTPDQTVAGRVNDLIKNDSPLIEMGRTNANEQMNARGLINSSMAVGESDKAAYSAALPIAQQDANAALTVGQANTAAENQAKQLGASSENQLQLQKVAGQQSLDLATLQGNIQTDITNLQNQNKTLLQTNDSAARFFSQISQGMADILKEPNIDKDGKQALLLQETNLLKNGLAVIGGISNMDLKDLLNFGSTTTTDVQPAGFAAPDISNQLMQTAFSRQDLGDWTGAREALNQVVARYPGSPTATTAEQKLAQMTSEGH